MTDAERLERREEAIAEAAERVKAVVRKHQRKLELKDLVEGL